MRVWRYFLVPTNEVEDEVNEGDEQRFGGRVPDYSQGYISKHEIPAGTETLQIAKTSRGLALYALVPLEDAEKVERTFFVCGNNVELPEGASIESYCGMHKDPGGETQHVFELVSVAV